MNPGRTFWALSSSGSSHRLKFDFGPPGIAATEVGRWRDYAKYRPKKSRKIIPKVTIKEGKTPDDLRTAIQVDPMNARLAAHFGKALADHALEKGTDPDQARRARGEADFQTRRALKLAPDNEEVKKLCAEVVKLLNLPSDPKRTN